MKKISILLLWIGLCQSIFLFAQSDIEKRKIEFLLKEVEQLTGAKVWRNGVFYSPKEASDFLRMKMQWSDKGKPIKNAKEFIENVASTSTMSRKPYQIYFNDGTKMEMKTFLYEKLSTWKE